MNGGLINDTWALQMTDDRVTFHAERPRWEHARLRHASLRLDRGMCVYDVGAECGDFTALYRTWVGDDVIPIEPQPAYWPAIKAHWEANGGGRPPAGFVGFAAESTDLNPPHLDVANLGALALSGGAWPPCADGEIMPDFGFRHLAQQTDGTPRIELDNLVQHPVRCPPPDVLMIDVEGAEWNVLVGARALLAECHPLVYVSASPGTMHDWYGHTIFDVHDLMTPHGYRGRLLDSEHEDWWYYE